MSVDGDEENNIMKMCRLEYYDWIDREWKPVPDVAPFPAEIKIGELRAAIRKGAYKKSRLRVVHDDE
jgi:hypothetical protein